MTMDAQTEEIESNSIEDSWDFLQDNPESVTDLICGWVKVLTDIKVN